MTISNLVYGRHTCPHNGTAPSIDAARSAANRVAADRQAILRALHSVYPDGLTDQQLQDMTGIEENSERPRRGSLEDDRLVERLGERRPTRSGVKAFVFTISAKGRLAMQETP
jgi:hypothetical protein